MLDYQRRQDHRHFSRMLMIANCSVVLGILSLLLVAVDFAVAGGRFISHQLEWIEISLALFGTVLGLLSILEGRKIFDVWSRGAIAVALSVLSIAAESSMSRIIVTSG